MVEQMKIRHCMRSRQCCDGRIRREYILEKPLTRETINSLSRLTTVTFNEKAPVPMVTFSLDGIEAKAVFRSLMLTVWLDPSIAPDCEAALFTLLAEAEPTANSTTVTVVPTDPPSS